MATAMRRVAAAAAVLGVAAVAAAAAVTTSMVRAQHEFDISIGFVSPDDTPSVCEFQCGMGCSYYAPCGFDLPEHKPDVARGRVRMAIVVIGPDDRVVTSDELADAHLRKMHVTLTHQDHATAFWHGDPEAFGGVGGSVLWVDVWFPYGGFYDLNCYFRHAQYGERSAAKTFYVRGQAPPPQRYDWSRGDKRVALGTSLRSNQEYPFFILREANELNPTQASQGYEVTMDANEGNPIHKEHCVALTFTLTSRTTHQRLRVAPYLDAGFQLTVVPYATIDEEATQSDKRIAHVFGYGSESEAKRKGCLPNLTAYPQHTDLGPTLAVMVSLEQGPYSLVAQFRLREGKTANGTLVTAVFNLDVLGNPFVADPVPLITGSSEAELNAEAIEDNTAELVHAAIRFAFQRELDRYFEVDLRTLCQHRPERVTCDELLRSYSLDVWIEPDPAMLNSAFKLDRVPADLASQIYLQLSPEDEDTGRVSPVRFALQVEPWRLRTTKYVVRVTLPEAFDRFASATSFVLKVALRRVARLTHARTLEFRVYARAGDDDAAGAAAAGAAGVPGAGAASLTNAAVTAAHAAPDALGPSPYLTRFMLYEPMRFPDLGGDEVPRPIDIGWSTIRRSLQSQVEQCKTEVRGFRRTACLREFFGNAALDFGGTAFGSCIASLLKKIGVLDSCWYLARYSAQRAYAEFGFEQTLLGCTPNSTAAAAQGTLCREGCEYGLVDAFTADKIVEFARGWDAAIGALRIDGALSAAAASSGSGGGDSGAWDLEERRRRKRGVDDAADADAARGKPTKSDERPPPAINRLDYALKNPGELRELWNDLNRQCRQLGDAETLKFQCASGIGSGLVHAGVSNQGANAYCEHFAQLGKLDGFDLNACLQGIMYAHVESYMEAPDFVHNLNDVCTGLGIAKHAKTCAHTLGALLVREWTGHDMHNAENLCHSLSSGGAREQEVCLSGVGAALAEAAPDLECPFDDFHSHVSLWTVPAPDVSSHTAPPLKDADADVPWSLINGHDPSGAAPQGTLSAKLSNSQLAALSRAGDGHGDGVSWIYYVAYSPNGARHKFTVTVDDPYPHLIDPAKLATLPGGAGGSGGGGAGGGGGSSRPRPVIETEAPPPPPPTMRRPRPSAPPPSPSSASSATKSPAAANTAPPTPRPTIDLAGQNVVHVKVQHHPDSSHHGKHGEHPDSDANFNLFVALLLSTALALCACIGIGCYLYRAQQLKRVNDQA